MEQSVKINIQKKSVRKKINNIFIFFILVFPFLHMLQGTDLVDTQYNLYNAATFFDSESFSALSIFSSLINAIFYAIFPKLITLYAVKSICVVIILIVSYKLLQQANISNRIILIGLLISELFFLTFYNISEYNVYSCLLGIIALSLFYNGCKKKSKSYLFFSGAVSAFMIFFRFPNITMIFFLLINISVVSD